MSPTLRSFFHSTAFGSAFVLGLLIALPAFLFDAIRRDWSRLPKRRRGGVTGKLGWAVLAIAVGFLLLGPSSPSQPLASAANPTDQVIVAFNVDVSDAAADAILASNGVQQVEAIPALGLRVVRVPPGQDAEAVASRLARNPLVSFAEPNALVAPEEAPNDPSFNNQWHHGKIETALAWDKTKASGVLVAICDTGVFAGHEDLQAVVRGDLGWNSADGSKNWADEHGHGTSVAGAAAAATNNGLGGAGVAWGAQVIPVRITNRSDGSAYVSDAAKCINYAADKGARVINLSYRMAGHSAIDSAGKYAQGKGAVVTVAAGNDNQDPGWPNYKGFLAVAATTSSDGRASYSNYGAFVDVSAPGSSIYTTRLNGSYASVSGTSFAAPVAAGVLALIFAQNPSLTATQAENILLSTSDDLGAKGWDPYFGAGRVNAARAVGGGGSTAPTPTATPSATATSTPTSASPTPTPSPTPAPSDTTPPTVNITSPGGGSTVSGTVSVSASASDNVGVARVEFYAGTTLIGSRTSSPWTVSWDTTKWPNGGVSLRATAFDAAGNSASHSVSVTVDNGATLVTRTFDGQVTSRSPSASFETTVGATGPLSLDLTWGGKSYLSVAVYDSAGTLVIAQSGTGGVSTASVVPAGTYRLVVTLVSGGGNTKFKLTVTSY